MPKSSEPGLVLSGLDGGNPLGFLAAVGTLNTASVADSDAAWRMKWIAQDGSWFPALFANRVLSGEELAEFLASALQREATPEFDFDRNLSVGSEMFRKVAQDAQRCASSRDRRYADFVTAFGCEVVVTRDGKSIQNTALRTMSGAGHQHFLGTMKQLCDAATSRHLLKALFNTWDYSDVKLGLRWDPEEDRRYALRWGNPSDTSKNPIRTMSGANRLAVEALPLLPTVPDDRRLETTGFTRRDGSVLFTWPVWECAVSLDAARSLLALAALQESEPDRTKLRAMGVAEVYRSQRITVGKYRNFTHAYPA